MTQIYGVLTIKSKETEILFADGSKTVFHLDDNDLDKVVMISGNKYEYFKKGWIFEIEKIHENDPLEEDNYQKVEGVLKDLENNLIEIGLFSWIRYDIIILFILLIKINM